MLYLSVLDGQNNQQAIVGKGFGLILQALDGELLDFRQRREEWGAGTPRSLMPSEWPVSTVCSGFSGWINPGSTLRGSARLVFVSQTNLGPLSSRSGCGRLREAAIRSRIRIRSMAGRFRSIASATASRLKSSITLKVRKRCLSHRAADMKSAGEHVYGSSVGGRGRGPVESSNCSCAARSASGHRTTGTPACGSWAAPDRPLR